MFKNLCGLSSAWRCAGVPPGDAGIFYRASAETLETCPKTMPRFYLAATTRSRPPAILDGENVSATTSLTGVGPQFKSEGWLTAACCPFNVSNVARCLVELCPNIRDSRTDGHASTAGPTLTTPRLDSHLPLSTFRWSMGLASVQVAVRTWPMWPLKICSLRPDLASNICATCSLKAITTCQEVFSQITGQVTARIKHRLSKQNAVLACTRSTHLFAYAYKSLCPPTHWHTRLRGEL